MPAVQVLRKSQAVLLIRQALMLPSVLIKVKSRDVTGQERDAGGLASPLPSPTITQECGGWHSRSIGGRAGEGGKAI